MDLNYYGLNPWQRGLYKARNFFAVFGKGFCNFWINLAGKIAAFFVGIFRALREFATGFTKGDAITKTSYAIMGFGHFTRGQTVRGIIYLGIEIVFFLYMFPYNGFFYMLNFFESILSGGTFGKAYIYPQVWSDEYFAYVDDPRNHIDHSFKFLLYGILSVCIVITFIAVYIASTRESRRNEQLRAIGKRPATFAQDVRALLDGKFHITLLTIPFIGVMVFTVIPLITMILIAFTSFDKTHMPPRQVFSWVGIDNFADMFSTFGQSGGFGHTFLQILLWTIIWAFFATFTSYFGGMLLAILINRKGIRLKRLYRTLFISTIAVPQFVSLLLMSMMLFSSDGYDTNNLGIITRLIYNVTDFFGEPFIFNFSNNTAHARIGVIIVNMWIGIPYTMLMCSGILMNIPADLYESARIDGASPLRRFMKITLPYMMFVTGPYLITQFIGNINNFNVIFLLTGGGPAAPEMGYDPTAKGVDLLVTWLYRLTIDEKNYKLAAVIGILSFVVSAVFSLVVYNRSSAVKGEENFQ